MLDALDSTIADAFDALAVDDANPDEGADDTGSDDLEPELEEAGDDEDGLELDDDVPEGDDDGDEGDGEPDDGDGEDDGDPVGDPITVTDDDVIRLPDGTEVSVKESALRQADYTRKTQQLADERRALEEQQSEVTQQYEQLTSWVQDRSQDPVKFAAEIAASTGDPTLGVAKVIKHLADSGQLDPQFAEAFGLTVDETIGQRGPQAEIDELKQTFEQEREQREQQAQQQQVVQHYLGQWDEVKQSEGVQFQDLEAEKAEFREVVEYAREHRITDLRRAYAARAWENRGKGATSAPAKPDLAVRRKKRAASAVTPRSSAGTPAQPRPKPRDVEDAASRAFDEVMARSGT